MPIRVKLSAGALVCLLALCIVAGQFASTRLVDIALQREARSLGLDWARHIENRIPDLESMRTPSNVADATLIPDPEEFHKLLSDVTTVGHIYQFDFINSLCLCELSIGAYVPDPDQTGAVIDDHSGHDHGLPGANNFSFQAIDPQTYNHVLNNEGGHAAQKVTYNGEPQFPIDRAVVGQIIENEAQPTLVWRNLGPGQPETFAEVYHPVSKDGELLYLLRVLVNLEDQERTYAQFFRFGTAVAIFLLTIALGGPAIFYFKSQVKQRESDKRAHFLAHHDALTNLHNRNDFHEAISDIIWRCHENNTTALLFLYDLNKFKDVNDLHGHQAGDKILAKFASELKKCVPEDGYIARLGGDEFAVVLGDMPDVEAHHETYLSVPNSVELTNRETGVIIRSTVAGGVARYPRDADSIENLVQAADLALYAAKPNQLGETREYVPSMKHDFLKRAQTRDSFRIGLEQSQIEPHYQPIINMTTGKVVSLEALARWNHPEYGLLAPFSFETIFDDTELSALLGQQMLNKIVLDMKAWKQAGIPFGSIGLNVLDSDLEQNDFANHIAEMLAKNGLTTSELTIEVTENCLFTSSKSDLIGVLEQLYKAGHPIALDDFGTGYSSITQLKDVPISTVKIDKSFIDNVTSNHADQSIINAILALCQSMGLKLILEGVETLDQRNFLRDKGFTLAQGFYYARPMPASKVAAFIQNLDDDFDGTEHVAKAG